MASEVMEWLTTPASIPVILQEGEPIVDTENFIVTGAIDDV